MTSASRRRWRQLGTAVAVMFGLIASSGVARADIVYRPSLEQLCMMADAIVEADVVEPATLAVTRVVFERPQPKGRKASGLQVGTRLALPVLAGVDMDPAPFGGVSKAGPLRPVRALVFLTADGKGGYRLTATGSQGSPSTYWADAAGNVYGYSQLMNPGDLQLVAGGPSQHEVPAMWRGLSQRVVRAMSQRTVFEVLMQQPDQTRAIGLANYLALHSSPPGYRQHTIRAGRLRAELGKLGSVAVAPLVGIIQGAPGNADLSAVVRILMDIGPPAAPALGVLKSLRAGPGATHVGIIDSAIAAISAPPGPSPKR